MIEKLKEFNWREALKKFMDFILNPRLLICFAAGWMITNGWSYIFLVVGTLFNIPWMATVGGAYLAFLWLPISAEKVITCAIAIFLLKKFFPDDQKTLAVLVNMKNAVVEPIKKMKNKNKVE